MPHTMLILALTTCITGAAPAADGYRDLQRGPDAVTVTTETGTLDLASGSGGIWSSAKIRVTTLARSDGLHVSLSAPEAAVKNLRLHWQGAAEPGWKYLGDAWERGYGDLEWRNLDGKRPMPWYVLASDGRRTHAYGVMTQTAALCCWKLDERGLTLLADVRCGGAGVRLGERTLEVGTVATRRGQEGETPFAAARTFCRQLCPLPRSPRQPVYGFNNWYCDYGNSSADSVRQDAAFVARLVPTGGNRPFMVIDDGWQANHGDAKGAWDRGNAKFPDMAGLAADMVKIGTRPGIWVRLLAAQSGQPESWRLARDRSLLDPSVPEVRTYVTATIRRLHDWGYELIKHDYSTFDLTGKWGFQMTDEMTADGWSFADRSRTTAEIILDHYRSIREGGGDAVLIGCNTIGHLSAGIFELSRTGDDTSGKEWDRVRKMGVNTLAFRMPQHGAFFAADADCVGQTATDAIPWEKNRQWLDLLARSGTPLFVSFKRGTVTPEQERALKAALAVASKPLPSGEPLDWFDTRLPRRWKLAGGETDFTWFDSPLPKSKARPSGGKYDFEGTISREVLENFLSRSISVEGVFNGRGDLDDNIRMFKDLGVKYAGRSLCLWGAENNFLANLQRARKQVPKALAADPEMVLEACVFETVGPRVSQIAIPDWVFKAFGLPVEKRNFAYEKIIYPPGQRQVIGRGQVPDVSRQETQLWFYYQAASYIDLGFEGIHFGQVEIMNRNDRSNAQWHRLLTLVRANAARHARRHMVLCNGHTPSGGLVHDGKLLLDFHAFPLRIKENPEKAQDAILQVGFSDGIYNRSKGGMTFSGWRCEHLPYLVEIDNWGVSRTPGQPGAGGIWVWGYDEITWFAHQGRQYRADWLKYAWTWVRKTDPNGYLQMPGSRTASSPDVHWYFANNPSSACPAGSGDEEAIRAVWAADAANSDKKASAPSTQ